MELNSIYQGDCIEFLPQLEDESVEMILTDIPYGVINRSDHGLRNLNKGSADVATFPLEGFLDECIRVAKGSIYIFCGTEQVSCIREKLDDEGLSTRVIIWEKSNPSPLNGQYLWLSGIELCIYGKKSGATFNAHCRNTVLKYPVVQNQLHPTEKNLDLFKELIRVSSNEGDVVLDPCVGSGTSMVAASQLGRHYIGFDSNPKYVEITKERL